MESMRRSLEFLNAVASVEAGEFAPQ